MIELYNLPDAWQWAKFEDVASVDSNLVDPAKHRAEPHIAPNHIESKTGKLLEFTTVEEDGVKSSKHLFHPGHILYSKIRPYLAKAVVVDFGGLCSADMYPVSTTLETRYLHRWMLTSTFTEQASRKQGRTVLPKINQEALAQLPVPVPPLNEQRRIVAKIEDLTARSQTAKQALDAIPPLLERFRQSVLAAAFRGDLTKQWRQQNPNVEPATELLKRIRQERRHRWEQDYLAEQRAKGKTPKDDKWKEKYQEPESVDTTGLPELPEGWCWASVEDVGSVQLGRQRAPQHHQGANMRPYLRVANVFEARIDTSDIMEMNFDESEFETFELKYGDILLNEGQSKHLVGRAAIYRDEVPGACFQNTLVRYRTASVLSPEFALLIFRHYLHCGRFQQIAKWTTSMAHLGAGRFAKVEIPLPPLAEQHQIVSAAEDLLSIGSVTERQTDHCEARIDKLNQSILAKAFRGELVPQDPNDEPASALLERIRAEREAPPHAENGKKRKGRAR